MPTHVIAPASTSVTAFLGTAENGPLDKPIPVHSLGEYQTAFGPTGAGSQMGGAVEQFFANGGTQAWIVRLTSVSAKTIRTAETALNAVPDLSMLVMAGVSDRDSLDEASHHCSGRKAFLIADSDPSAKTPEDLISWAGQLKLQNPEYAAVYAPWVRFTVPSMPGSLRTFPPSGSIAGIYAQTDTTRGVWHAPAGTNLAISGADSPVLPFSDSQIAPLAAAGVNAIRKLPVYGVVPWGARTLAGASSDFQYVPVRRLASFIERSIEAGTQWAQFEPNAEQLWSEIRLAVSDFLNTLFLAGAFTGNRPQDAYFARCDSTTTTQSDVANGILNILVGFAPLRPAQFVILTIQQFAGKKS